MESLCRDILYGEDISLAAETGQEWFDEIKNYTLHIYELNGIEFMKNNNKYVYLLIEGNENYETSYELVSYSDGIAEIDGGIIGYDANIQEKLSELTQKQVDQMMYNAVQFYKSAFLKVYETLKNYSSEEIAKTIDDYKSNPSSLPDLFLMMDLRLLKNSLYMTI